MPSEPQLKIKNSDTQALQKPKTNPPKKRDWYFWMGIMSIFFSMIVFTIFMLMGETESFIFTEWYQFLIPIPAFFGSQLSGGSYVGRTADFITDNHNPWTLEKCATLMGIIFGLSLGIGLVIARTTLSYVTGSTSEIAVHLLSATASIIGSIGSFGGLGNRIGSALKKPQANSIGGIQGLWATLTSVINKEKLPIMLGVTIGLATSLTLWFTGAAALTVVVGVTSFVTGGAAIPFWVAGGLFVLGFTGTNASAFDYFSKTRTFIKAFFYHNNDAQDTMQGKFHEFRGSAIGVTIGIIIATAIVITLFVTQPYLAAFIGAIAVTLVCASVLGGICSRIGRVIDGEKNKILSSQQDSLAPSSECDLSVQADNQSSSQLKSSFAKVAGLLTSSDSQKKLESLGSPPAMILETVESSSEDMGSFSRDQHSARALVLKRKETTQTISSTEFPDTQSENVFVY